MADGVIDTEVMLEFPNSMPLVGSNAIVFR